MTLWIGNGAVLKSSSQWQLKEFWKLNDSVHEWTGLDFMTGTETDAITEFDIFSAVLYQQTKFYIYHSHLFQIRLSVHSVLWFFCYFQCIWHMDNSN